MIHISQGFYTFRFIIFIFFILFFSFFLTNPWYLVRNAKRMLYCEQRTVWLSRRRLNTMLLTNFENLNSILNIFVTGERPSSDLKVTKIWFGPNIKYVSEPFFADFCCRQGITCLSQITSKYFQFNLYISCFYVTQLCGTDHIEKVRQCLTFEVVHQQVSEI